jgi:hypothetical protein
LRLRHEVRHAVVEASQHLRARFIRVPENVSRSPKKYFVMEIFCYGARECYQEILGLRLTFLVIRSQIFLVIRRNILCRESVQRICSGSPEAVSGRPIPKAGAAPA